MQVLLAAQTLMTLPRIPITEMSHAAAPHQCISFNGIVNNKSNRTLRLNHYDLHHLYHHLHLVCYHLIYSCIISMYQLLLLVLMLLFELLFMLLQPHAQLEVGTPGQGPGRSAKREMSCAVDPCTTRSRTISPITEQN